MTDLQQRVDEAQRRTTDFEKTYATATVPRLIAEAARRSGASVAIDFFERGERATYEELHRGSTRVAHALRAFGVRKGDRVAIMLPNRLEFPLVWFACAKLGAIVVPVNMRYTPREIAFVLGDTQARFAVVDESVWPTFSGIAPWPEALARERVVVVGQASQPATTLTKVLGGAPDAPIEDSVGPDDVLAIQYTSGTTGFPKGCILTHDFWGIVSAVQAYRLLGRYERHLCWAPLTYVDGMIHLLSACRDGATLYMPERLSATRFVEWLKTYRIEWVSVPELLARQPGTPLDGQTCLQQYQFGGGTWNPSSVVNFKARYPVCGNGFYGLTETGYATLPPNDAKEMAERGASGLRAPFRELKLVDDAGAPVPAGQAGELWIRGRGLFQGYWNRPDANAELFDDGWFKSGDYLRCDELGFYYFVGRKKDMIRRSNENIAAREVEAVICELAEVSAAAAVAVPDADRGEEVKIWVELKPGVDRAAMPVERILEHARSGLAAFKVPRYVCFHNALPRVVSNPNKVDKRELVDGKNPFENTYDGVVQRWL